MEVGLLDSMTQYWREAMALRPLDAMTQYWREAMALRPLDVMTQQLERKIMFKNIT